jgi:hypothetical protein
MCLAGLGAALLCPPSATAAQLSVDGVSFSDELGGFVLERLTGNGTLDSPFVVTERIVDGNGGDLVIRVDPLFGNQIGTQHAIGFALVKVVENGTDFPWTSFELELQSTHGVPSDYADGLSFGQGSSAGRPFSDIGFKDITVIDEPYDRIEYDQGRIPVGGQATFRFVVTETMPLIAAYLAQRPRRPVANLGSGRNPRTLVSAIYGATASGCRWAMLAPLRQYRNS